MSDEILSSQQILTGAGGVSVLLLLWIALLKFLLGRYVKAFDDNTTALGDQTKAIHKIDVRLARVEGGLGLKAPEE